MERSSDITGADPSASERPATRGRWRSGSSLAGSAVIAAVAAGVLEWAISHGPFAGGGFRLLVLSIGLWLLVALGVVLAEHVALLLVVGGRADSRVREGVRSGVRRWLRERGNADDHKRVGLLVGGAVAIALFWLLSVWVVRNLVENRNDALWIGLAAGTASLGLIVVSLAVFVIGKRWVAAVASRAGRWLSAPLVVAVLCALALYVVLDALLSHWSILVLAGLPTLLFPACALLLQLSLWITLGPRVSLPLLAQLILLGLGIGLVAYGAADAAARLSLADRGWTSRHVYASLANLSDIDRDGVPSPPFGADCAPFDGTRHPLALEVPENGLDENCDGLDRLPDGLAADTTDDADLRDTPTTLTEEAPDLVLITVDSLRADHLGFMGYDVPTTPDLDRLASEAVVFTRAYSQDSGTGPSLWSFMTGKTPFQVDLLEAHRFPPLIAPHEQTLAELLKEAGYQTAALLCAYVFGDARWNLRRGFDIYREVCGRRQQGMAELVTDRTLVLLGQLRHEPQPFFLWVHYYDPHHDFVDYPDIDFGTRHIDHYDEEIRYTQEHLVRLVEALRAPGNDRPVFIAISADHGENFHEHGPAPHARNLYREATHVPLVILGPGLEPRRIDAPVALNDLYPTFLSLAHTAVPPESTMVNLVPVLAGAEPDLDRYVFQENSYSRPRRHVKGVIWRDYHMLLDLTRDTVELYDMVAEPAERQNLIGRGLEAEARMRAALNAFLQTTEIPEGLSP